MRKRSTTLTTDERSVLILVARGLTNKEIAEHLGMTLSKVKMLLYGACNKMKARNRIEAVFLALRQRAINIHEIYTLNELVELTASLGPETVETVAQVLRQRLEEERVPAVSEEDTQMEENQNVELTEGEKAVLIRVARGMTNQEIANQLCTSPGTVKMLLYQACMKLKAPNRAQAFITALRKKAINVNEVFALDELVELLSALGPDTLETLAQLIRRRTEQEHFTVAGEYPPRPGE